MEDCTDLGETRTSELGYESGGFGRRLPWLPALVLAFSSHVNLDKLCDFSEYRFSDLSNGSTRHTGGCKD